MATYTLDALRDLLRHMEWADATVWRALDAHSPAVDDARTRDLLLHLHRVQRAFLVMWTVGPQALTPPEDVPQLTEIRASARSYYADLSTALAGMDDASLTRLIEVPWLAPYEERMGRRFEKPTLAETVMQVVSHSTYHRGQVNARLREIGGEPPLVDYIAWIWFGRPAPEWPSTAESRRPSAEL